MASILKFQRLFPDEHACRDYLFQLRWPDGYNCPRCEHPHCYEIPTRRLYECRECRMQTSVTAGTIMHGTKLPLRHWFMAMFLVSTGQPCSARWLATRLNVNYRSALGMLRKIRRVMRSENGPHMLAQAGTPFGVLHTIRKSSLADSVNVDDYHEEGSEATIDSNSRSGVGIDTLGAGAGAGAEEAVKPGAAPARTQSAATARMKAYEVVTRAKEIMVRKAATFIKRAYRNVKPDYIQGYIDEFYYRRTGSVGIERYFAMLAACVLIVPVQTVRP